MEWHVVGLRKVTRTDEASTVLPDGRVLCQKSLVDGKNSGFAFLVGKKTFTMSDGNALTIIGREKGTGF